MHEGEAFSNPRKVDCLYYIVRYFIKKVSIGALVDFDTTKNKELGGGGSCAYVCLSSNIKSIICQNFSLNGPAVLEIWDGTHYRGIVDLLVRVRIRDRKEEEEEEEGRGKG